MPRENISDLLDFLAVARERSFTKAVAEFSVSQKRGATLRLVGVPASPHLSPNVLNLVSKRRSIAGSMIGGIAETQEMLDFCAEHSIISDREDHLKSQLRFHGKDRAGYQRGLRHGAPGPTGFGARSVRDLTDNSEGRAATGFLGSPAILEWGTPNEKV